MGQKCSQKAPNEALLGYKAGTFGIESHLRASNEALWEQNSHKETLWGTCVSEEALLGQTHPQKGQKEAVLGHYYPRREKKRHFLGRNAPQKTPKEAIFG